MGFAWEFDWHGGSGCQRDESGFNRSIYHYRILPDVMACVDPRDDMIAAILELKA